MAKCQSSDVVCLLCISVQLCKPSRDRHMQWECDSKVIRSCEVCLCLCYCISGVEGLAVEGAQGDDSNF